MTKLNLEQMEADRKAGTQGEWVTGPLSKTQVSSNVEPSSVCSTGGWSDPRIEPDIQYNMQLSNARRIARVPQLEAMVSDMVKAAQMVVIAHAAGDPIDSLRGHVVALSDVLAKHAGEA